MHDTIYLNIAGWRVDLRIAPPSLAEVVARRYADFISTPEPGPDLMVEVENGPSLTGEGVESDSILHGTLTTNVEEFLLDGPKFYGMIHPSRAQAALRMRSAAPEREVEYFLRIALALFALQRDGLLLHCAALKRTGPFNTGRVYLFVGQSGSGKSTLVQVSHASGRAEALGDDLILLRRGPRGWLAYGTPFWNFEAEARKGQVGSGPVAGIYKLVQDRRVYVEPMRRAVAAAELVANCPIVNAQPALLPVLIDRCRDVAQAVPVSQLHFRKDDAFWDVIAREAPC